MPLKKAIHVLDKPIEAVAHVLHTRSVFIALRSRRTVKCVVGAGIMCVGVTVAHEQLIAGPFVSDIVGYGIHAWGTLPFLKLIGHYLED